MQYLNHTFAIYSIIIFRGDIYSIITKRERGRQVGGVLTSTRRTYV